MDDDAEWERLVAGIVGANAALARVVPRAALGAGEFDRARHAPAPSGPTTSLLDDILRELRAAAAVDDDATRPAPPAIDAVDGGSDDDGTPSCGSGGGGASSSSVAAAASAPSGQAAACPRPTPDRIAGLGDSPCPVCLSASSRSQYSVLAPCWHRFCFSCISTWLRVAGPTRARCPTCRGEAVALLYSIRTADDYKYRLLQHDATAVLGDLEPAPSSSRSSAGAGRTCSVDAEEDSAAGAAAKRGRQVDDDGGGHRRRHRPASASPALTTTTTAAPPPGDATAPSAAAAALSLPRALVQQYADGSVGCSVEETDRVRAALGLPPLQR
jgi:hypothetical protein